MGTAMRRGAARRCERAWRAAAAWCALGAGLLVGSPSCTLEPATEVIVELKANDEARANATRLRVVVVDTEDTEALRRIIDLPPPGDEVVARVPLVPTDGDPTRRFELHAELLGDDDDTTALAKLEVHGGYVEHELRIVRVAFDRSCPVECGPKSTCYQGSCVGACFHPEPQDTVGDSRPECGECEICAGNCQAADTVCGCAGDVCVGGKCQPAVRVDFAAAGNARTCAVRKPDEEVFCWGQLGASADGSKSPVPVSMEIDATRSLAVGNGFQCAFDKYDDRYCWGRNTSGQLGATDPANGAKKPKYFEQGFTLLEARAGMDHLCGRSIEGEAWCWGSNLHHQVMGTGDDAFSPEQIELPIGTLTTVTTGGYHSCAIVDGKLFCWGYNQTGQCGSQPLIDVREPSVRAGCTDPSSSSCIDDWKAVSGGLYYTCAIRKDGALYCWGANDGNRLGLEPGAAKLIASPTRVDTDLRFGIVSAGDTSTCAIGDEANQKRLYCWGQSESDALGRTAGGDPTAPVEVTDPDGGGWTAISTGTNHACAIRRDMLWCWGGNADGEVGIGSKAKVVLAPHRVCLPAPPP